ncbi:hypothetical protein C8R44DRAFT_973884 [Mycena epipterygia]|nr:hypothetical protein C8R44DRAFT_973884 [Mycena epipterygia]
MPRTNTTPTRRTKREATRRLARISSSSAGSTESAAQVKLEPSVSSMPPAAAASLTIRIPASPTIRLPASPSTWRHPAELAYIRTGGETWHDMTIIRFLRANALSIPPRSASITELFTQIRVGTGPDEIRLPRAYRIPLLWVAKFQWSSLALVLGEHGAIRQREWDAAKFEILHISRLCARFVDSAQAAETSGAMDKGWRCAQFDRPLRRYWNRWLIMRDEFVRDFHREFGEKEYEGDVLKLGWSHWVLRGHKGFALTKDEVNNGICAEEFMRGFVVDEQRGTFKWVEDSAPSQSPAATETLRPPSEVQKQSTISSALQDTSVHIDNAQDTSAPVEGSVAALSAALRRATGMSVDNPVSADGVRSSSGSLQVQPQIQVQKERIPLPGERRRSREHATPNTFGGNEMPAQEHGKMGPIVQNKTGCAPFREHPTDVFKALTAEKRAGSAAAEPQNVANDSQIGSIANDSQVQSFADNSQVQSLANNWQVQSPANSSQLPSLGGYEGSVEEKEAQTHMGERESAMTEESGKERNEDPNQMEDIEQARHIAPRVTMEVDEVEDDDDNDLQLLYPATSPLKPNRSPIESASPYKDPTKSPFRAHSCSRSSSPLPPLSAACFLPTASSGRAVFVSDSPTARLPPTPSALLAPAIGTSASSYHLAPIRSPVRRPTALPDADVATGLLARWSEEMHLLRAEVDALRAEIRAAPRIGSVPTFPKPQTYAFQSNAGHGHPLQHLIAGDVIDVDSQMDVDSSLDERKRTMTMVRYMPAGGEPLPPRSRKFSSGAMRFEVA